MALNPQYQRLLDSCTCPALKKVKIGTLIANLMAGIFPTGSVGAGELASNAVETAKIKDANVTPGKLADTVTYRVPLTDLVTADVTAAITARVLGIGHGAGTIVRAGMTIAATGADASDPLDVELDVAIDGTSVFTTKPKADKSSANGVTTFAAATGVVPGVLDAAAVTVGTNSKITYTLTPTRTTPETEISGVRVWVEVAYKVGA